jgi:hypothetical protein
MAKEGLLCKELLSMQEHFILLFLYFLRSLWHGNIAAAAAVGV